MIGKIHSFESCGMSDGPGIRNVIFLQGCPLRCKYCHNPDTWKYEDGRDIDSDEIIQKVLTYKGYIKSGGITLSGGEPLMQKEFALDILKKAKANAIHTCIDTSGYIKELSSIKEIVENTDLFLIDLKHFNDDEYLKLTGVELIYTKQFIEYINSTNTKFWIRFVLIPGLTDNIQDIQNMKQYLSQFENLEKIEVLPFHKLGEEKWKMLQEKYELADIQPPSEELLKQVKDILEIRNT